MTARNLYGRGRIDYTYRPEADAYTWHVYGPDGVELAALPSADLTMPGAIDASGYIAPAADTFAHALAVLGLKRAHAAAPALAVFRDGWDAGDPWGSGMLALGAVCDILYAVERSDLIPSSAGYSPAAVWDPATMRRELNGWAAWLRANPDDTPDDAIDDYRAMLDVWRPLYGGRFTVDDVATAARILSRYVDVVRAAGRDY